MKVRGPALAYVLVEDAALVMALLFAVGMSQVHSTTEPLGALSGAILVGGVLICLKLIFYGTGLYEFRRFPGRIAYWRSLGFALVLFAAGAWLTIYHLGDRPMTYWAFLLTFVPAVVIGRLGFAAVLKLGPWRRRVLFLGTTHQARRTAQAMLEHPEWMHKVVGFLTEDEDQQSFHMGDVRTLGLADDLEAIVREHQVQQVIVAVQDRRKGFPIDALLRVRLSGVDVQEEARVHEEITGRIPVEDLRPSHLIFSEGFTQGPFKRMVKRGFDLLLSLVGLLMASPLVLLATAAIRFDSKGPIFYGQKRVGLMGKEFTVWKFRSMRTDAEADGKPRFAAVNDNRVTAVGRFLRKSRIDEIPQMWNVLRGDMSFVGPRPERRFFVDQLREKIPFYDLRHMVKPGITGWAQVRYSYGAGELDAMRKLRYDMFYIKHQSVLLDLRVLVETVGVVLDGELGR